MTFLFWNVNRTPLLLLIEALVRQRGVDVLMLAENVLSNAETPTQQRLDLRRGFRPAGNSTSTDPRTPPVTADMPTAAAVAR